MDKKKLEAAAWSYGRAALASVAIPSDAAHCPRLLFVPGQTTVALST